MQGYNRWVRMVLVLLVVGLGGASLRQAAPVAADDGVVHAGAYRVVDANVMDGIVFTGSMNTISRNAVAVEATLGLCVSPLAYPCVGGLVETGWITGTQVPSNPNPTAQNPARGFRHFVHAVGVDGQETWLYDLTVDLNPPPTTQRFYHMRIGYDASTAQWRVWRRACTDPNSCGIEDARDEIPALAVGHAEKVDFTQGALIFAEARGVPTLTMTPGVNTTIYANWSRLQYRDLQGVYHMITGHLPWVTPGYSVLIEPGRVVGCGPQGLIACVNN